jgi:hypothetical protein
MENDNAHRSFNLHITSNLFNCQALNPLQEDTSSCQIHMRDKRFIAEHRGGLLIMDHHKQLIKWACRCSEHVLPLLFEKVDERLINALFIAKEWAAGNAKTGDAMKASVRSHAVARESVNPVAIAIARSIGQAVATAHMADHSLGAAIYALKAVKLAGKSIDAERKWQNKQLPSEIRELILPTRTEKEHLFKDLAMTAKI